MSLVSGASDEMSAGWLPCPWPSSLPENVFWPSEAPFFLPCLLADSFSRRGCWPQSPNGGGTLRSANRILVPITGPHSAI